MAERKDFFIRINRQLVSVSEEVYLAYYRMYEHEQYLIRKDRLKGKVLYSDMDTNEMLGEETIPDLGAKSIEDMVIGTIMAEKLQDCLCLLLESERELIMALFFNGYSEIEMAAQLGINQSNISRRKNKILAKLKKLLEK